MPYLGSKATFHHSCIEVCSNGLAHLNTAVTDDEHCSWWQIYICGPNWIKLNKLCLLTNTLINNIKRYSCLIQKRNKTYANITLYFTDWLYKMQQNIANVKCFTAGFMDIS